MTYRRIAPPVESPFLAGVRRLCREILNARQRNEITLNKAQQQLAEDIERGRFAFTADSGLRRMLAAHPDPAYRQQYLELVRAELGIDLVPSLDVAHIDDSETRAQGAHDVAWSHFDRLLAKGVQCRASARRAWETGTAHAARLGAQLNYLRTFL